MEIKNFKQIVHKNGKQIFKYSKVHILPPMPFKDNMKYYLICNRKLYIIRDITHKIYTPSFTKLIQVRDVINTCLFDISKIKKLVITDQLILKVNLNEMNLRYLDLRNNYLREVIYDKYLEYCDLTNNSIKEVCINARILILRNNRIRYFIDGIQNKVTTELINSQIVINDNNIPIKNDSKYQPINSQIVINDKSHEYITDYLDLSYNPLKVCKTNYRILKINHTKLKHFVCKNQEIIECKQMKKLKIYGVNALSDNNIHTQVHPSTQVYHVSRLRIKNPSTFNYKVTSEFLHPIIYADCLIQRKKYFLSGIEPSCVIFKKLLPEVYYVKYKLYHLCNRFYVVYRNINDIRLVLSLILSQIKTNNLIKNIEYMYDMMKVICEEERGCFYLLATNRDSIIIRSYNISLLVEHSVGRHVIRDNDMHVYVHCGNWSVIPYYELENKCTIICKYTRNNESSSVSENITYDILKEQVIKYNKKYQNTQLVLDTNVTIFNRTEFPRFDLCVYRKCSKPDNMFERYIKSLRHKKQGTNSKKLFFMFVRFNKTQYIEEQMKLINKVKKLKKCTIIEDNGTDGLIYMSQDKMEILNFAIYYYKAFVNNGLYIGVGVSCGSYFFKMDSVDCKFMGNVLNKASRLSIMGNGVFCCPCLVKNNKKYNFQYHGEYVHKGFNKSLKIHSIHTKS